MARKRLQRAASHASSSSRTSPSWCSCTCASTATAPASGPTRRCAATSWTPGRCCRGCTSSSARTARPATSARRRRCRAPTTRSSSASPTLREQEELDAIRPDLDGNEIMAILGIPPGPLVGPGLPVPAGAADGARPARPLTEPSAELSEWYGQQPPARVAAAQVPDRGQRVGRADHDAPTPASGRCRAARRR